jgi:hypothetical protein
MGPSCVAGSWCEAAESSVSLVCQSWCNLSYANPMFHARTKHVEVDYHFVHERVASKLLDVRFISTSDQIADGFTKALTLRKLKLFRHNLNVAS